MSALARLLWSDARRSRWRTNSSRALRVTVSCSSRFWPRSGTRTRDLRAADRGEPLLVERRVVDVDRHEHGLRDPLRRVVVEALDHVAHQLRRGEVLDLVDDEALAADDPALAHEEHLDGGLELVVGDAEHVEVLRALGHHLLLLDRLLHAGEPVAQPGGLLELELAGRLVHAGLELLHDRVGVAVEELEQRLDVLVVLLLGDLADARARALLDVEQEAGPAEALVLVELVVRAGAQREGAQQQVEGLPDGVGVAVGPEVLDALALAAPHHHRAGPLVVHR